MRKDLWLMSVNKWSYYVWACEVESQPDIKWAEENLKCGYCKRIVEKYGYDAYSDGHCKPCMLYREKLCGFDGSAYHITVDTSRPWRTRRSAARKMLRAILADMPKIYTAGG